MKSPNFSLYKNCLPWFSADLYDQDTRRVKSRRNGLRGLQNDLAAKQRHVTSDGWWFVQYLDSLLPLMHFNVIT